VVETRGYYDPRWHYEHDTETRAALDLIAKNHFSQYEHDAFEPVLDALLEGGDHYLHLADLKSYCEAHQRVGDLYQDPEAWSRKAVLNIAASGRFSSDRTIAEYAQQIWDVKPHPIAEISR
jgi:starch phosphorylase